MTFNNSPFLRNQRNFPNQDTKMLSLENDRAYIDIATKVNDRTIGIYALNAPVLTGEKWYLTGSTQVRGTTRQLYTFTSAGNIKHGLAPLPPMTRIYGTYTDNTKWYPLPYVDTVNVTNQVSVSIGTNNISIVAGAGAPTIRSGFIVIEYLST